MCYDVKYLTKKLADYEKRYGDLADLTEIARKIDPSYQPNPKAYFHSNGFAHEALPIIKTGEESVDFLSWGLVPSWTRSRDEAFRISNNTLNARGESLFEKPSFRLAAKNQRCIVLLDGFYEHHHRAGKTFPYHIQLVDESPMSVAGLWDSWVDPHSGEEKQSVTIVTTSGNTLMAGIHNHPKLDGPRMPVILDAYREQGWLDDSVFDQEKVGDFLEPFPEALLKAHTVRTLRGKNGVGNQELAMEPFAYQELQKGLFDV